MSFMPSTSALIYFSNIWLSLAQKYRSHLENRMSHRALLASTKGTGEVGIEGYAGTPKVFYRTEKAGNPYGMGNWRKT
jgi:hypothetical protein